MGHAALRLAEFTAGLRISDLPSEAIEAGRRHLLDVFGVAIRGRAHENALASLRGIETIGGSAGGIAVWGSQCALAAPYAALANGVASHVLDFDDTHTDSIVHGSAIIAPVVMALAQQRELSGEEVLLAFVAGWEVAARVGLAAKGSFHQRGFHTTSIAGIFGAAAAAARLLGLDAGTTAHAIGLAGSQASGINEYLSNSSSAKSLHTGWAAQAGLIAAHLAQAGMTGPLSIFEGRDGLLRAYGMADSSDAAQLDMELGSRWEVTRVSIKPYPCCHFAHAFVDCVGALMARGIGASAIAAIHCVVPDIEVPLICEPFEQKLKPATPYAAKFSLPYLLAAQLADGRIGHATFEPAKLSRPELIELAVRVSYRVAKPGETPFPKAFPGWIEVQLTDGRSITERLDVNAGHPDNPLSLEQVAAKFKDNALGALGEEGARSVVSLIRDMPHVSALDLAAALVPRGTLSQPKPELHGHDRTRHQRTRTELHPNND